MGECRERAYSLHEALNYPATPPEGTSFHLFAGDAIPTVETLTSNLAERTIVSRSEAPGDRTVTRKSTLADRRTSENFGPSLETPIKFDDVRFLFGDHFELTRDAGFTDNALFLLLEDPSKSSPARAVNSETREE